MEGHGAPQGAQAPAKSCGETARPVDGAANAAVERAVAGAFGVAPRAVRLVSGPTGRSKVLFVAGEQADLYARLSELLAD